MVELSSVFKNVYLLSKIEHICSETYQKLSVKALSHKAHSIEFKR